MPSTKTNKNNGVKIKNRGMKKSIISIANFRVGFPIKFPLTTALLELSAPLIRSTFYPDSFL